ncbi:hypothetical protein NB311A_16999 [Nitrobacter sp. Nb-311A]|nr:hypothetical protein NB311A_16999 [Nitrobacter sp. Nb-311A]
MQWFFAAAIRVDAVGAQSPLR